MGALEGGGRGDQDCKVKETLKQAKLKYDQA